MFFLLPVGVDYRTRRLPMVTFVLIGINIAVYIATLIYEWDKDPDSFFYIREHFWLMPSMGRWYAYFTSLFVHAGFWHLFGNMIFLFLFGSCVEDIIGRWKYLIFYLLGGLAADFVYIAATREHFASTIPLGGASGAISACIGGFVVLQHKTKINFRYFIFLFFRFWTGEFQVAAWIVITFWFLKDFLFAAIVVALSSRAQQSGGVAFAAHVGGSLAGLAMIGLYRMLRKPDADVERQSQPLRTVPLVAETPTIHLFENGNQMGPFTLAQISQMLSLGSLSESALYWEDGMPEWRPIGEVRDRMPTGM